MCTPVALPHLSHKGIKDIKDIRDIKEETIRARRTMVGHLAEEEEVRARPSCPSSSTEAETTAVEAAVDAMDARHAQAVLPPEACLTTRHLAEWVTRVPSTPVLTSE